MFVRAGVYLAMPQHGDLCASPPSPTCKWVRTSQVVTRQVHEGSVFRVDKLWLGGHVISVFHGVGCVDHIHLRKRESQYGWHPKRT